MPGFFITNTKSAPELCNYCNSNCIQGHMQCQQWNIQWNVLNKYMDDKIFADTGEAVILLDGVILNKNELMTEYGEDTWLKTVISMLRSAKTWFEQLRGVFSGAVYDKAGKQWTCFTDQCGEHLLMTYSRDGNVAIGSQVNYFSDWMKANNIERHIDKEWEQDIISSGYMRESYSVISGVRRIYPGHYCEIADSSPDISEYKYYMVTKADKVSMSDSELIDRLDELFHNAVRRILEKDREYGYSTIVDISGGLDSRMNAAVAKQEDCSRILGVTYAQSGSPDHLIAHNVASTLGVENIFYPMDGGSFLEEIDDLVFMNGGFNYYFGITAGKRVLELLDTDNIGSEIWGLLGDIYEGAMISENWSVIDWSMSRYLLSRRYASHGAPEKTHEFEDNELLWFYVRGMLAGMNTGLIRQNYIEPLTPYGDVEFMNFCFSIPFEKRVDDHIYRKWMIEKYPDMAKIVYSRTGVPVMSDKSESLHTLPIRIRKKLQRKISGEKKEWYMNPFDFWYKENDRLSKTVESYYDSNRNAVDSDPEFSEKISDLFQNGNTLEKLLAVSILSSVKQFIN